MKALLIRPLKTRFQLFMGNCCIKRGKATKVSTKILKKEYEEACNNKIHINILEAKEKFNS